MENILQLLTGKQAAAFLNLSYETFIKEVRKGAIGYKIVGSVRRYPLKALEEWLNNTMYHFEYTSVPEDRAITRTSHTFPKQETEYSLESLLEERQKAKQMNIVLKDWRKSNKNNAKKQTAKIPQ